MSELKIDTAEVFLPLLEPYRYKGGYGGRGSGKSHFFAELLVEDALRFPGDVGEGLLAVCIREVQKSLKESAYRLIVSKLEKFGLGEKDGFRILNDRIITPKDGLIIFQGMQDHNAESIKSLEGFHRAWAEEAQTMSKTSLKLLRPTIRWESKGMTSELWFGWNPRYKSDPVDHLLRHNPPSDCMVVEANWKHNPWFPAVLQQERNDCLDNDPDQYNHIWEGGYLTVAEGAYYSKQISIARNQKRTNLDLVVDPLLKIQAWCDIGSAGAKSDAFVIWIFQDKGNQINVLDYYEAQGQEMGSHAAWLRNNNYGNAVVELPHDGGSVRGPTKATFQSAFRQAGFTCHVNDNVGTGAAMKRVQAVRRLFPAMRFDKKCEPGLEALGWYHEKIDENRQIGLGPEHDWSSHAADAFGEKCVNHVPPSNRIQRPHVAKMEFNVW